MSRRSTSVPSPASFERSSHRPQSSLRHTCSLPAVPVHPVAMVNRVDQLEDRVVSHEKTPPVIVKQAFRLKEEIVNSLRGPQSKGVGEQDGRQLLEEHIQTITAIVSQLNRDIEVLQEQIHARDGVSYGTNTALKSLEMQHLSSLSDLRWRIARCDASISILSAEVKSTQENIQNLAKEHKRSKADVECKIEHIEIQISRVLGKTEQSVAQQEAKIKAIQGDSSHQLHLLEAKLEGASEGLKSQLVSIQNSLEKEQERAVTACLTKIGQLSLVIKEQTDKNAKIVEERCGQLSMKLDKIEEVQKTNLGSHRVKHAEEKENDRINKIEKKIWKEIQDMRAETNAGFAAIHESLGSLRHVLEDKIKLEKDQLQKQILQVKKMTQSSVQENQQKLHIDQQAIELQDTDCTPYAVVGRNTTEGADTPEPYSVVRLAPGSCSQEMGDAMKPERDEITAEAEPNSVVRLNTEYEGAALSSCEAPKPSEQQGNGDAPADHKTHIYDKDV